MQAVNAGLIVYAVIQREINALEQSAYSAVKLTKDFEILQTIRGIGKILGLTTMLETGDFHCFASAGNLASYYRCVDSTRTRNGKKKGAGNTMAGNKYLSWGFSEAVHFAVRFEPQTHIFTHERRPRQMVSSPSVRTFGNWSERVG